MAKFICPFCSYEYSKNAILYTCPDCGATAVPHKMSRIWMKCKTLGCSGYATLRKCPICGTELPEALLEGPIIRLGLVGTVCSGKTSYITAMLHEFERESNLGLSLQYQTNDTLNYQRENEKILFEEHSGLPATAVGVAYPMIWEIQNFRWENKHTTPRFTCVMYDRAGEHFECAQLDYLKDIEFSEAMLIVIDPLTLRSVRGSVDESILKYSLASDYSDNYLVNLITGLPDWIDSKHGHRGSKKIEIPVAIVLTKIDTIMDRFERNAIIKQKSAIIKNGRIDIGEVTQLNNEIKRWLEENGEGNLVYAVDSLFKDYSFFGVSSYGTSPSSFGRVDEIYPHRVLDPVLWLYYRIGF